MIKHKVLIATAVLIYYGASFAYTPPVTDRVDVNFNTDWKYNEGDATGADAASFSDASWTAVTVPHSTKWVTHSAMTAYEGISWYRKHFTLSSANAGKKVFLEFGAAMQVADLWLNGKSIGHHEGGYMSFMVDITSSVTLGGSDNVLAIKTDSRSNANWAPGRENPDFQYYGGLYRNVTLHITNNLHVTDALYANKVAGGGVFVTYPAVSTASATVSIKTDVINENTASKNCTVLSELVDAQGNLVGSSTGAMTISAGVDTSFSQTITVPSPKLWHPNSPNLYTVHTTVKDAGVAVDYYKTRIGIRRIQWTHGSGIQINGQSFQARGSNLHQDIYGLGNARCVKSIYYDLKRYKEGGLDFVRGSHYPHDPMFYDACDEFGILVEDCMTGWQFFADTDPFKNNTYKEVRGMLRRDRNHPSVIVWETQLNETSYTAAWAAAVNTLAHAEYPGDQMFTCGTTTGMGLTGACAWDVLIGAEQASIRNTTATQPIIICEYGSFSYGGANGTSSVHREDPDAALLQQCTNIQMSHNKNRAMPWYSANGYWVYSDYSGYLNTITLNQGRIPGIVDYCRIPKFSYYFFQSQRDPAIIMPNVNSGPMVFIANRWTAQSPTAVRVFSNCEKVSLYLNNALVETRSPDADVNCTNLLHPPFTFTVPQFVSGTLRADGLIGNVVKATYARSTPGSAAAIKLRPEANDTLIADGSDTRLVWIDVVDAAGAVVPTATNQVTISATAPGSIIGPTSIAMIGGQLATWVRAGTIAGTITVNASSSGLTPASITLVSGNAPTMVYGRGAPNSSIKSHAPSRGVFLTLANDITSLSPEFSGKPSAIAVFDISGRLLKNAVVRERTLDVRKDFNLSPGIYIVLLKEQLSATR
jgi:hypothetical protein